MTNLQGSQDVFDLRILDGSVEIDSQKDVNIRVVGDALIDVEGNLTADAAGDANIIVGGDVDIDATANIEMDAVDVTVTASGNLRTKSNSSRFQNAAENDDLTLVIRDFIQTGLIDTSHGSQTHRDTLVTYVTRLNALR